MKKYIISSGITLLALSYAGAAVNVPGKAPSSPMMEHADTVMMMLPVIATGDAAIDTQIKTLQQEMETKIKAIRDEYHTKIKAVIGDKKVITRPQGWSSTTPPKMMKGEGEGRMMRGTSTRGTSTLKYREEHTMDGTSSPMRHHDDMMRGTSTRPRAAMPTGQAVRGESTEGDVSASVEVGGFRGFFSKLFER